LLIDGGGDGVTVWGIGIGGLALWIRELIIISLFTTHSSLTTQLHVEWQSHERHDISLSQIMEGFFSSILLGGAKSSSSSLKSFTETFLASLFAVTLNDLCVFVCACVCACVK